MTYAAFVSRGPLDIQRSRTDFEYLIAFGAFIFVWFCVAVYAFRNGDSVTIESMNSMYHLDIVELIVFIAANIYEPRYVNLGFSSLSLVILIIYIVLFRWATKVLIYVTMFLMTALLIVSYGLIFYVIDLEKYGFITLLPLTIIVIMYGIFVHAFRKIGIKPVSKIIRESCKAMFFFPSTLGFMVLQYFLHIMVICYAGSIYICLDSIRNPLNESDEFIDEMINKTENDTSSEMLYDEYLILQEIRRNNPLFAHVYFLHVINVIGFLWLNFFVSGLGRMVLTASFTTWYHCKDKSLIPAWTISECLFFSIRHHSGTVAYASSPMAIIPMIIVVYKYGRNRLKEILKKPFLIFSWLIILAKFPIDALAICAMHGHKYYKSAKDSYILLMNNPLSITAINTVTECIIFVGSQVIPFLSLLIVSAYWCWVSKPSKMKAASVFFVTIVSYLMTSICFSVFRTASNTIHRCYLEDSKFNNESEMNVYEIQVDDDTLNDVDS